MLKTFVTTTADHLQLNWFCSSLNCRAINSLLLQIKHTHTHNHGKSGHTTDNYIHYLKKSWNSSFLVKLHQMPLLPSEKKTRNCYHTASGIDSWEVGVGESTSQRFPVFINVQRKYSTSISDSRINRNLTQVNEGKRRSILLFHLIIFTKL